MSNALLAGANPLLILAVVLVAGVAFGSLARRLRLPSVTGQIVAGMLIGRAGLQIFEVRAVEGLHSLTQFALGLMAVTVGAHLNVRRLRNAGKRLLLLFVAESLVTPGLVFATLVFLPDVDWSMALLFGTLAISTAPATIVAIVGETRSKGVFVKTLVAAVALNNMACILLFELAHTAAKANLGAPGQGVADVLVEPILQLFKGAILGGVAAVAMEVFARVLARREKLATAAFVTLLLVTGAAQLVDVSPLLAALFLGLIQANIAIERDKLVDALFSDFWPAILAIFFTLAGMELTFEHARTVGVVALLFFASRFGGKLLAAYGAMRLAGATQRLRNNLGLALVPQAGVAIGLLILLQEDPAFRTGPGSDMIPLFGAVVLTVVTASEIVGPILTRWALKRSGEAGRDRMRLIDFIHEEDIVTDLRAATKKEAIVRLVDVLAASHRMTDETRSLLLSSVLEREEDASTCLGGGLAVPHGILPEGFGMMGAMGLSREGLDLGAPDGQPVHCAVLLATPDSERDRHLQVLAALARTLGLDPGLQARLWSAKSPAHAYEILHDEESEDFNYFLEGSSDGAEPASTAPGA